MSTSAASPRRKKLSFRDRLSRLTLHQAKQLLGDDAQRLFHEGRTFEEINLDDDIYLGADLFRVRMRDRAVPGGRAIVVITQISGKNQTLHVKCDQCELPCGHAGAALNLLLEDKLLLGLSAAPDESVPLELLTDDELLQRAMAERQERADTEKMRLQSADPQSPWTDYVITSRNSGKTYRVALRGPARGQSYCSCPDFRTNHLGTCKHILHTLGKVTKRFTNKQLAQPYQRENLSLRLDYGSETGLRFNLPHEVDKPINQLAAPFAEHTLTNAADALRRVRKLEQAGHEVHIYPDAEEWIQSELLQAKLRSVTEEMRANPTKHPLRKELLHAELLPYQLDGIAFAVGAGRAILADDMGLGKTIQGIGVAELLAREAGIRRVLVVCPASLKSQWRDEILRFSNRTAELILGNGQQRAEQYRGEQFFSICNYEQVLRDLEQIEQNQWDLIILDEGQRIKNWESKTSQLVRSLRSQFALVLSGTPLENRLDELYTVVKFVDDRRLGPAYRFFHRHRVVDDKGRVEGYRNLDQLREQLKPILLRRTRGQVMKELPERTTSVVRIRPTAEQAEIHRGNMLTVAQITSKAYITEMDLLRLQKALLMCRMSANSTFLVDKQEPSYSSKLDRLNELLGDLAEQEDRKIVLFSEWRTMLNLIEPLLEQHGLDFVRLDGQVPQKKRPAIVNKFQSDPNCRVILLTNAGSTGLNLQKANTVINVDLPWNPAVLEQRIARAHRMGQRNPVHVYMLVTEDTLEERLLDTLAMKHDLAIAALDVNSEVSEVQMQSGMEELKRRLEQLIGEKPAAPVDQSQQNKVMAETLELTERRQRVASAGGELVGAALQLVSELMAGSDRPAPDPQLVGQLRSGLEQSVERDEAGRPQLRIALADDEALGRLAQTLAQLLVTK